MFFFLLLFSGVSAGHFKILNTGKGAIKGKDVISYRNHTGYAFLGIPFGKPPVGVQRFKEVRPVDPWEGVWDATRYANACFQNSSDTINIGGVNVSEDCMYINVFTSENCINKGGCSIIVNIHGGQRNRLTPAALRPEVLVNNFANNDRNVIFVTIPYRMGIVGWLNLSPGLSTSVDSNLPNRDCHFALQWIQKEIKFFGGDPKKVTLLGHSSGGQTIAEIALSPYFNGLFSQAILMSETDLGEKNSKMNSKFSQAMAVELRCATSEDRFEGLERVEEVIDCLRKKTSEELWKAQATFTNRVEDFFGTWIDGPDGVFPGTIENLLRTYNGSVNFLMGTVTKETLDTRFIVNPNGRADKNKLDILCENIAYDRNFTQPQAYRIVCNQFYETRPEYINDDYQYHYPTIKYADAFSKTGKVYVYSYAYNNTGKAYKKFYHDLSPQHTEDFMYVSGLARIDEFMTPLDYYIEEVYSGMLCNFANFGDPTWKNVTWEPWVKKRSNYFLIDFDKKGTMPGMRNGYYREVGDFVENIVPSVAGEPSPLTFFPPKYDMFVQINVVSGYTSLWTITSTVKTKSYASLVETKNLWEEHLVKLKELKTLELNFQGFDWTIYILAGIVLMISIVFLLDKVTRWWHRRQYFPLDPVVD